MVFTPPQPYADEPVPVLVGTVLSVTDGDTIKVQLSSGPIAVRMYSIDAPEKDQPWGTGRRDINAWMVSEGNAWVYRDYLKDASYCYSEADARSRRLGLWGLPPGSTYAPWEWRAPR